METRTTVPRIAPMRAWWFHLALSLMSLALFAVVISAGAQGTNPAASIGAGAISGGAAGSGLDAPFGGGIKTIGALANVIFKFGVILCVLAAAVFIATGAFMYFAAAGNASAAARGKEYISQSLIGLLLALIAWVILTTIHPQFTELPPPSLGGGGTGQTSP